MNRLEIAVRLFCESCRVPVGVDPSVSDVSDGVDACFEVADMFLAEESRRVKVDRERYDAEIKARKEAEK